MKILALDLGDQWIGSAISDELGIIARPHKTIRAKELPSFLRDIIVQQPIATIIIGNPITMRGTISAQTEKIQQTAEQLMQQFPTINWVLWDERLTSKKAAQLSPAKTKEATQHQHSVAAALILESYLQHLAFKKSMLD